MQGQGQGKWNLKERERSDGRENELKGVFDIPIKIIYVVNITIETICAHHPHRHSSPPNTLPLCHAAAAPAAT